MLASIDIDGLRTFQKFHADLRGLNVLIGANASGKTTFIKALELLHASSVPGGLRQFFKGNYGFREMSTGHLAEPMQITAIIDEPDIQRENLRFRQVLSYIHDAQDFEVTEEILDRAEVTKAGETESFWFYRFRDRWLRVARGRFHGGADSSGEPEESTEYELDYQESVLSQLRIPVVGDIPSRVRKLWQDWAFYCGFQVHDKALMHSEQKPTSTPVLTFEGDNLPAVLAHWSESPEYEEAYADLEARLPKVYPGFRRLYFPPTGADGVITMRIGEQPFSRTGFSSRSISDGTLRFLCLCAVLLNPKPPALVCIEEPEIGLHPDALIQVADMMKRASKRTQLAVTTHSPYLVEQMEFEDVIAVEKYEGRSEFRPFRDNQDLKKWVDEGYSMGSLWVTGHGGARP